MIFWSILLFWLCESYYEVLLRIRRVPWTIDSETQSGHGLVYAILYLRNLLEILHAGATGLRTPLLHRPPVSLHIFTLALDRPELDCYSVVTTKYVLQNTMDSE